MIIKVAAACAIVVGGFAAWYALSAAADRGRPAPTGIAAPAPLDAHAAALTNEIARLERRLQPTAPPQRGRDVFRFATVRPASAPAVPIVLPVPAEPPAPSRPALRLIGVAEDNAAGRPVRTAIIASPDQLYVVKEGEQVTSRYGVARISADVVELVDTGDASALRLVLK